MTSEHQKLMQLMGTGQQVDRLSRHLQSLGFEVRPSRMNVPGIFVRYREGTTDEADIQKAIDAVGADVKRGPSAASTTHIANYRT
jgi:hypothetical protein